MRKLLIAASLLATSSVALAAHHGCNTITTITGGVTLTQPQAPKPKPYIVGPVGITVYWSPSSAESHRILQEINVLVSKHPGIINVHGIEVNPNGPNDAQYQGLKFNNQVDSSGDTQIVPRVTIQINGGRTIETSDISADGIEQRIREVQASDDLR
jgi:hypothetical protein